MAISQIILLVVHIYSFIVLLYCIFSWFPNSRGSGIIGDIYRALALVIDPYLNLFRRLIPPIGGTLDISPIVGIFALEILANLIIRFLYNFFIF